MATLLQRHLCSRGASVQPIIEAIESGELDPARGIAENPQLILQVVDSWERHYAHSVAFQNAQLKMVQILETHGADPWQDWDGSNLFTLAYRAHNAPLMQWAADHPRAPVDLVAQFIANRPLSPLFGINEAMIKVLVDRGAPVDGRDEKGNTPLHTAHTPEKIHALLEAGVDGYAVNQEGMDARDAWDKTKLPTAQRRDMESALAAHCPMRAEKIIRTFGAQIFQGGGRTRDRLKEAGVDPEKAQWKGFGLVELLVCEALNNVRDEKGDKKSQGREDERWLKAFETTFKWVGGTQLAPEAAKSVQAAAELFFSTKKSFGVVAPAIKKAARPGGAPEDEIQSPAKTLTRHPIARRIDHCIDFIERAVETGLLTDGSYVAANLVSQRIGALSPLEWLVEDANGQARLLNLLAMATRGTWDQAWSKAPADAHSPLARLPIDLDLVPALMAKPHGIGILLLAQTRTKTDILDKFAARLLDELSDQGPERFILSHNDPWLVSSFSELERPLLPAALRKLGKPLALEAQRQDLNRQTPTSQGQPKSLRL